MTSQTFSNSLDFVGSSLSSQGTGVPAGVHYTIPASLDPSFGTSFSSSIDDIPVSGAVNFQAGLTGSLAITLGQFSPNIPVNVAETVSTNSLTPGQVFSVNTALTGGGSESFSMLGPGLTANLDLGISGSAGFFINKGSSIASLSINPSFNISAQLPTSHAFSLPDGIGSVIIAEPMPFTSTGSAGPTTGSLSSLSATGTDTSSAPNNEILGGTINFLGVVQAAVPELALSGSLSVGVASLSYNLLSVPLNIGLGLQQSMTLTPLGIGVSLSEFEGSTQIGNSQTGSLGSTFSFQAPTNPTADPITINTTYSLDLGVMTNTGITGVISLNIVGPQVSATAAFGAFSGSIGPLFNASLFNASTGLGNIASENFSDFLSTSSSFSIPISSAAPCYLRGTHISTDRGEIAVEDLVVGDRVNTASGSQRPVQWLGHRSINCNQHPEPTAVWPVRIQANAFGNNTPSRDLYLSPGHSVSVNGVLIQASNLVNGASITVEPRDHVEYWHVELDSHDVMLAEGLPAESYLDTGNRTDFLNGGAHLEMYPDFKPRHWKETCAPLVMDGPELARVRGDLHTRALAMGYQISRVPDVCIKADGHRIDPVTLTDDRLAFVVPAAAAKLELVSQTFVPSQVHVPSGDTRELGICVKRLQLDGVDSNLSELTQGWHKLECHQGDQMQRWTAGRVPLPRETRLVVIDMADYGYFWSKPALSNLDTRIQRFA